MHAEQTRYCKMAAQQLAAPPFGSNSANNKLQRLNSNKNIASTTTSGSASLWDQSPLRHLSGLIESTQ